MSSSIFPIPCSPRSELARAALLLAGALAVTTLPAATRQDERAAVACTPAAGNRLHCDYRLKAGGTASGATLAAGTANVAAARLEPFTAGTDTTAVLILVDTSDPGRQPVMNEYAAHIGRLLALATPQRRFGLASFDADLVMLAAPGAAPADITRRAAALRATGLNTELYRNAIEGVKQLAAVPAARRELVLLSDGLAEDTAYHLEDVVHAARAADVVISAIGYPRSTALAVGMQTLRRLAEETGGVFAAASGPQAALPDAFFTALLAAAESGGTVDFALDELAAKLTADVTTLTIALQSADGPIELALPIPLAHTGAPQAAVDTAPPAPSAAPAAAPAPEGGAPPARKRREFVPPRGIGWPIAMATPVVLILGIAVAFFIMARRRSAEQPPITVPAGNAPAPAPRSHAFLVAIQPPSLRHAISSLPWRIGRSRNNDLRLEDRSVSRLHAEIRMNDQGRYVLCDLASANGVFVNGARVESAVLEEGDRVEIGEVELRYTCHDEHYEAEEPTIMIRTRTPE
ncbi:MAG: FHA domain-containing protein [Gammaproteobacteria bacterium]|nr:FHA domain-containing protein [Gammaproteobacteria bacterium]